LFRDGQFYSARGGGNQLKILRFQLEDFDKKKNQT
jgi:hypothetical protein